MGLTDEELQLISDFTVFDWVEDRAKAVAALSRFRPEYMSQASRELDGVFAELARALTERDALLKRLEVAEGLAVMAKNLPTSEWVCPSCHIYRALYISLGHEHDCELEQALAAWRAADGG